MPDVASEPASSAVLRFPLRAVWDEVAWVNGSFAPEEAGLAGGFVTGAFVKEIELGHLLPLDVPARVEMFVTMDAEEAPFVGPTARADPFWNGTVIYESQVEKPAPGALDFRGIVRRASEDTFGVALEAYAPATGDPTQVSFSVRVAVHADPGRVPGGVPVALELAPGDGLRFGTEQGGHAEVLIFDPKDALVARLPLLGAADWTPPEQTAGEYVVMPVYAGAGLEIERTRPYGSAAGALRALDLTRDVGAAVPLEPLAEQSWRFAVDSRPLRILATILGPEGEPWVCSGSPTLSVDSPAGRVLEQSAPCPSPTNLPFLFEEEWTWASPLGDPLLVPGTYEVRVENSFWQGHVAYHAVEGYTR